MNIFLYCVTIVPFLWGFAVAQPADWSFGQPMPITPDDAVLQQPRWSPDGTTLALAGENYRGIWLIDPAGKNLRQVTDAAGAGYRCSWSSDSRRLLTRTTVYEGRRRKHQAEIFSVTTGLQETIKWAGKTIIGTPRWSPDESSVYLQTRTGIQTIAVAGDKPPPTAPSLFSPALIFSTGTSLYFINHLGRPGGRLAPVAGRYLNAELSPDGSKIAFEVVGGNLFVVKPTGQDLVDLGRGERPTWAPDSQWLAFMLPTDDGHRVLNSDIYLVAADGSGRQNATRSADRVEMNPAWAPDGKSIAFDEENSGRVFIMPLAR